MTPGRWLSFLLVMAGGALALSQVSCNDEPSEKLSRAELLNPSDCQICHPTHYKEWSGSMHAYAGFDPVFIAMNKRGQRETGGALGPFCVQCHAPMAVREGATTDGLNMEALPEHLRGVTCFFCHNATSVTGTHNAPITLEDSNVMYGSIRTPLDSIAHESAYSPLLDSVRRESAVMCGACHDIVNPKGAHIERTFAEWNASLFADATKGATCATCHMRPRPGMVSTQSTAPGVVHDHSFPGVDVALTPFPEIEAQRAMVQDELDATVQGTLCVEPDGDGFRIALSIENVAAGHGWPSGSTQDRRAWIEVVAYDGDTVLYQSGVVPDGQAVVDTPNDPDLMLLRDCNWDETGAEVHDFWKTATLASNQLSGPATNDIMDPRFYDTHIQRVYPARTSPPIAGVPTHMTMRVRLRPVGLDVLDHLVASGDLDPAVKAAMPTFDLGGATVRWTLDEARLFTGNRNRELYCVTTSKDTALHGEERASHLRCVAPPAPPAGP